MYARLAGCVFLAVIAIAFGGSLILPRIPQGAPFAEAARVVAASERMYRVSLGLQLIVTLGSVLLAFSLYATLKAVSSLVALLAMIVYLEDSVLSWVGWICTFVRVHLYVTATSTTLGAIPSEALVDLTRRIAGAAENAGGLCFGIGLLLFFSLFYRSRYIPRLLSALGVCASAIWTGLYLANVIFPEHHAAFQYISWPLMGIADVTTGFWLMAFSIEPRSLPK